MKKPRIQIVRGLPGSGKSTFAAKNWPHLLRLEFDYFCMRGGEYAFGDSRNAEGQAWLSRIVDDTMNQGIDFVLCGVFAGNAEQLGPTVSSALDHGYGVWIQTLYGKFGNIHRVRQQDYDRMVGEFLTDDQLELLYGNNRSVHFGSMPTSFKVAPMDDGM